MSGLIRHEGFCLICGNSVYLNQRFVKTGRGKIHESCLQKKIEEERIG